MTEKADRLADVRVQTCFGTDSFRSDGTATDRVRSINAGIAPAGSEEKVPPRKQFPVILEVALTASQGEALRRHAAYLGVPVSELLRSLVISVTESWTREEVHSAK